MSQIPARGLSTPRREASAIPTSEGHKKANDMRSTRAKSWRGSARAVPPVRREAPASRVSATTANRPRSEPARLAMRGTSERAGGVAAGRRVWCGGPATQLLLPAQRRPPPSLSGSSSGGVGSYQHHERRFARGFVGVPRPSRVSGGVSPRLVRNARAMASRCRWPALSRTPFSPARVSSPSGSDSTVAAGAPVAAPRAARFRPRPDRPAAGFPQWCR